MKKQLLLIATVASSLALFAQQNASFETWSSIFNAPTQPNNWVSANLFASPLIDANNPTSVFKDSLANKTNGQYSMKITTIKLTTNPDPAAIPDTLGYAAQGVVIVQLPTFNILDRLPFTGRPANFNFMYKYTPSGTDSAFAYIELTKWNTTLMRRDTIGAMGFFMLASTNFATGGGSLIYNPLYPNTFPDSLHISFSSSSYLTPRLGSTMWVDEISLTGWTGISQIDANASYVKAFPNPSNSAVTISVDLPNAKHITIYNQLGQTMGTKQINAKQIIIEANTFAPGNYYYSVTDENGTVVAGNTFTITH
jgi:hypothetical protein